MPKLKMVDSINMANWELNNDKNLDIFDKLIPEDIETTSDFNLDCKYYSGKKFIDKYKNNKTPLAINMNIQSLASKFDSFVTTLDFLKKKIST